MIIAIWKDPMGITRNIYRKNMSLIRVGNGALSQTPQETLFEGLSTPLAPISLERKDINKQKSLTPDKTGT